MAHTRIRKFNTSETYPEQNLDNDLCQAVVTQGGKTVWLRGQCPQNLDDAQNIESHDPVEQTHKVMQNIRQLIEEAGGSMEHLVKVVVYITDVRHREAIYRTMGEYIKDVHPVSTGLVVARKCSEWVRRRSRRRRTWPRHARPVRQRRTREMNDGHGDQW